MIQTTTDGVPGREVTEMLGIVRGNTIRTRHVGRDIMAGLKHLVGGEIGEYTKLMAEAREQCIDRMTAEAEGLGADAVLAIRFTTTEVMSGAAELMVYGTAVKLAAEGA